MTTRKRRAGRRIRSTAKSALTGITVAALLAAGSPGFAAGGAAAAYLNPKARAAAPAGFDGVCSRLPSICAKSGDRSPLGREELRTIRKVNLRVNHRVRQIEDDLQYGTEEYWTLPSRRGGDCEDIAMLKKVQLTRLGIAPERLLLATVLDRRRNSHAVLVLRSDTGDFILDSQNNRIVHWRESRYTYLRIQDPRSPDRWMAVLAGGFLKG